MNGALRSGKRRLSEDLAGESDGKALNFVAESPVGGDLKHSITPANRQERAELVEETFATARFKQVDVFFETVFFGIGSGVPVPIPVDWPGVAGQHGVGVTEQIVGVPFPPAEGSVVMTWAIRGKSVNRKGICQPFTEDEAALRRAFQLQLLHQREQGQRFDENVFQRVKFRFGADQVRQAEQLLVYPAQPPFARVFQEESFLSDF